MGSSLPFRSFESFASSGDDYEDYMSGSGEFWDGEFSGDFYGKFVRLFELNN